MAKISNLVSATARAIQTEADANLLSIDRRGSEALFEVKETQRKEMFGTLAELAGIGSTLQNIASENKSLIAFAEESGFETSTNKFTNLFGTPKFSKEGVEFTADFLRSLRQEKELIGKSMFDLLSKGGF